MRLPGAGNSNAVAWYRHIQAVDAALRMSDVHFADSILGILSESSTALGADEKIVLRVRSLEGRLLSERKLFDDAETMLKQTLDGIEGTTVSKNVAAAYCWQALAICYHRQKKADLAAEAQSKSIAIAEAALGEKDPETMLFKEPLQ